MRFSIYCPAWFFGRRDDLIAAWLSVNIYIGRFESSLSLISFSAIMIP